MKGNDKLIGVLNGLLADELTATNQYIVHGEMAENWGYGKLKKLLRARAITEMKHAEKLIERILFLEGRPIVSELNKINIGSDIPKQFTNDLAAEMTAVKGYNSAIKLAMDVGDNATKEMLDGILKDLRRHGKRIEAETGGVNGLRLAPSNDPEGDCGVAVAYQFENEAQARAFQSSPGVGGYVGIDHGKHVYTNWTPLREKRSMHHPAMNPFNFPQNKGLRMDYGDKVCPRTLELLRRTVFTFVDPDWTDALVTAQIETIRKAGKAAR